MDRDALPIDALLPELERALRTHPSAIVRAPTGAGKTTRVPQLLVDADLAGRGLVLMLEPRRLAARAAARRMAFERGARLGDEVGFHVRFDRQASQRTRILVVTEGLVVRMLQDDPFLEHVGAVVFDEFHERSLDTDLALALVRKIQMDARADLKIVVMSATIAHERLSEYLGDAPVLQSEGRLHPVEIVYAPPTAQRATSAPTATRVAGGTGADGAARTLPAAAAEGVARALEHTRGDVLVFLPGVGEIRRTQSEIASMCARQSIMVCELYSDLPADAQDAALRRGNRRRIVLATNVAETSVTVEGITAVVDTGFARTLRFDPSVGLDRLVLGRISRASADQRAGRAGRTEPGVCVRLWSELDQRSLAAHDEPEIRRVDLAGPVLQLMCFGERDVEKFPWFENPSEAAIESARELLESLGATSNRSVTPLGRAMASIAAHPRIARLLIEGAELGVAEDAALAGALLAERDPFLRAPRGPRSPSARRSDSDLLDRVAALEAFERSGSTRSSVGELNEGGARYVLRVRDALLRDVERSRTQTPREPNASTNASVRSTNASSASSGSSDEAFMRAVFAAYPDRLARRRDNDPRRGVVVGGRGVRLADESAVHDHDLFVCVDIDAGAKSERAEALVRIASAVEREWLPEERLETKIVVSFDEQRERVVASKRSLFGDLVIDEVQSGQATAEEVERVLAEAASTRLARALDLAGEDVVAFLGRVGWLRKWMPDLELPTFDEAALREWLPELCAGARSFEDTRKRPLVEFLRSKLDWKAARALEQEAPERIVVPSGRSLRLQYEADKAPVLAVRIQEVFGWADSPRLAGGRVKVLLHLLAPNQRPQQVTDDLKSFWNSAYREVRKELKVRYPKHSWPEDPWNAQAERRPKRPR
jgi:ATP-dependent helicase HrpB